MKKYNYMKATLKSLYIWTLLSLAPGTGPSHLDTNNSFTMDPQTSLHLRLKFLLQARILEIKR